MLYDFNPDIETRDKIIFGKYEPQKYMGGCRHFENMDIDTLQILIDKGFADPEDAQNYSPTIEELIEFAEQYGDAYTFDGYTVIDTRSDYRVSIEAIARKTPITDKNELLAFVNFARGADDWDPEGGYAWWD